MITAVAVPASAQTITAAISGQVRDAQGAAVPNANVTAVNEGTNQSITTKADTSGNYTLSGLRPGAYTISTEIAGAAVTDHVTVEIGQAATLDLAPAAAVAEGQPPAPAAEGEIVVTGRRLVETRTSEVATNVSQQQIRRLPQGDRNFLAFTQLAPGVKYNDSETNRGFQSGASTPAAVNVFIDGVNLKNTVLDQGVAGQQDSRGNPFAQLAVQEFRVLTQNFKAEYEQAGAAIVTSVTKSGTNQFHGDAFVSYTDKHLMEANVFDKRAGRPKPAFKRIQYGLDLGGPIIRDKLFFFGAYEGNDQDRASTVTPGPVPPGANLGIDPQQFAGNFISPFRGDLFFGKLTLIPDDKSTFDVSFSRRKETDIGGFGCNTDCHNSYEVAENKKNTVDTYLAKWTYRADNFLNEASIDYLNFNYNPTSLNPDSPTFQYDNIITFGGKDGTQDIKQRGLTFRDDLTIPNVEMWGTHTFKVGIKYSRQKYDFVKVFELQPKYIFRGPDFSFPQQAFLGLGDPNLKANNNIFGIFAQDDWDVTDKLQLNLGIRWDRESNMFNNKYVTPANAAAALRAQTPTAYFNPEDYITDGSNRPVYNMIQPRIGFSYDLHDDQRTVIFGGFGRYFDRNVFNNTLDEKYRSQYIIGRFEFSSDGSLRNGSPTVLWNPAYLTRDGLIALQATALTGQPELFAVKNNAKPPRTDQFSLGVRQKFGSSWSASVTGSYIRGKNGYTHLFATRQNGGIGDCCDTTAARAFGYSNVLIGFDGLDTRYKALYVTLDRAYTPASGWGLNIAYTLQKAEKNGNDLFSLDKPTPDDYGFRNNPGIERHSLVISGLLDLPWGVKFSTLTKLGSGQAFSVEDRNTAPYFDINTLHVTSAFPKKNCLGLFARCEVDVTAEKEFRLFGTHTASFAIDVFNLFNNKNYASFNGFKCCQIDPNVFSFGKPNSLLTLPRRVQFRAAYRF
ncbi:TonB-dependent receptor domain-containing protein [Sphingomonas sp.]|uniref:TonB-dependent receptor n=1 Tax=Sphingomonas sp. TaxID=28214 RepID=UPI00286B6B5D|nr:TonB-dependent receptor [Sphingomonas sp.]